MWQGRRVPANTAELLALLDLTRFGEMSFVAPHPRTRMQRTYGGQVLAQHTFYGCHSLHTQGAFVCV